MNLAKPREVHLLETDADLNVYDTLRLWRLQQIVTSQTHIPCSIASDCMTYHMLCSVHSVVSKSGDEEESVEPEDGPRFRRPVLTTNAIHTPLHEQPITDGMEHVELQENTEDVVNISSMHSTYSKSNIAQQMKEQRRKWDRVRRDAIRMQGHLLPEDTPLDERTSTRRQTWGPSVETKEMISYVRTNTYMRVYTLL